MRIEPHDLTLIFGLLFVLLALLLWRAMRVWTNDPNRPNVDIADLWMENGRLSRQAVLLLGSWAATTWAFVYVTLSIKHDGTTLATYTAFLAAYAAVWITPLITRIVRGDAPPPAPEVKP